MNGFIYIWFSSCITFYGTEIFPQAGKKEFLIDFHVLDVNELKNMKVSLI